MDLTGMRDSDFPGVVKKDQKMMESIQIKIADMIKQDGKKNLGNLTDKEKHFIRELL